MKNRNLAHSDNWATPPAFYAELNKEFKFDFDPCPLNHDITLWDGLEIEWRQSNFANPPYSQALKEAFVKKAIVEAAKGKTCVLLLPVSTSTRLFHDVIQPNAKEIRFVRGRLPFIGINTKGQYVNWHLLEEVDYTETISAGTEIIRTSYGIEEVLIKIPKHVKNSGMHDSMVVIF